MTLLGTAFILSGVIILLGILAWTVDKAYETEEEETEDCKLCGGSGQQPADEYNEDAHRYENTGTKPCDCREKIED